MTVCLSRSPSGRCLRVPVSSPQKTSGRLPLTETRHRQTPKKREPRPGFADRGSLNSGNVLLSHNLSMHYHRGCSVSLPCSEWERVVPLRYDHQKAGEAEVSPMGEVWGRSHLNFTRKSSDYSLRLSSGSRDSPIVSL